jgi:hypothetical protein
MILLTMTGAAMMTADCVAGVIGPARRRKRCGDQLRMRRIAPDWREVRSLEGRNYACCCTAFLTAVVPVLGETGFGCYRSVPSQPAAVMNNDWPVTAGVAFGFGLE